MTYGSSGTALDPPASGVPWRRFALWAVAATVGYAVLVGLATALIPNPVFDRRLAADGWNVAALVLPAVLVGPLAATYLVPWPAACDVGGRAGAGGVLSFFAAGCPVCNKLVVLAVGTSGALEWFRPAQPALGALSVVLLALALRARWRPLRAGRPGRDVGEGDQPTRRRRRASAIAGGT
jgi:hypothetical protein